MRFIVVLGCFVSFLVTSSVSFAAKRKIINVGTGSVNALAYPIMSSVCETYNYYTSDKEISCSVVSTAGSEENLEGIIKGNYSTGVIKADMAYNAYNGIGIFAGKSNRNLRSVFGLHNEFLTMIVKNGSGINSLSDFIGNRVYIGNKGSGSRILVDKLFIQAGWKNEDFKEIHEESADKIYDLFCNNKIDAAIYLIGHPNKIFDKTLSDCKVKMISFSKKEIESYVDSFRHIYPAIINKGTYPSQKQDIHTFASQLLLTASDDLDEEIVYNFVKIVSEHYKEIQAKNPALRNTNLFSREVNAIPLHKGSARFYNNSTSVRSKE